MSQAIIESFAGKIQWAEVTECSLNYTGSISLDHNFIKAAGLHPLQMVDVWNQAGPRIQTYVLPEPPGSRVVRLNGSAARHFQIGDKIIVCGRVVSPVQLDGQFASNHPTKVVLMAPGNYIQRVFRYEVRHYPEKGGYDLVHEVNLPHRIVDGVFQWAE